MNKYYNIYLNLIEKAKTRDYISKRWRLGSIEPDGPVETHHIVPKCVGGTNKKDNLVVFTPKEHFIAHMLLTKIYIGNYKLIKAFDFLCKKNPNKRAEDYRILRENTSNIYKEQANKFYERLDAREIISERSKEVWKREGHKTKMRNLLKQRNCPEYSEKLSKAQKLACKDSEVRKRKYKSIEKHSKEKTKEWVEKITVLNKERMQSEEWRKWASDKYKGSKFDNRRKVLDKLDGTIYDSAKEAAESRGLKYEVVKKWLYLGIPKHNLVWLDQQEKENGEIGDNSESISSLGKGSE